MVAIMHMLEFNSRLRLGPRMSIPVGCGTRGQRRATQWSATDDSAVTIDKVGVMGNGNARPQPCIVPFPGKDRPALSAQSATEGICQPLGQSSRGQETAITKLLLFQTSSGVI